MLPAAAPGDAAQCPGTFHGTAREARASASIGECSRVEPMHTSIHAVGALRAAALARTHAVDAVPAASHVLVGGVVSSCRCCRARPDPLPLHHLVHVLLPSRPLRDTEGNTRDPRLRWTMTPPNANRCSLTPAWPSTQAPLTTVTRARPRDNSTLRISRSTATRRSTVLMWCSTAMQMTASTDPDASGRHSESAATTPASRGRLPDAPSGVSDRADASCETGHGSELSTPGVPYAAVCQYSNVAMSHCGTWGMAGAARCALGAKVPPSIPMPSEVHIAAAARTSPRIVARTCRSPRPPGRLGPRSTCRCRTPRRRGESSARGT